MPPSKSRCPNDGEHEQHVGRGGIGSDGGRIKIGGCHCGGRIPLRARRRPTSWEVWAAVRCHDSSISQMYRLKYCICHKIILTN
jgi:hypothetical protein